MRAEGWNSRLWRQLTPPCRPLSTEPFSTNTQSISHSQVKLRHSQQPALLVSHRPAGPKLWSNTGPAESGSSSDSHHHCCCFSSQANTRLKTPWNSFTCQQNTSPNPLTFQESQDEWIMFKRPLSHWCAAQEPFLSLLSLQCRAEAGRLNLAQAFISYNCNCNHNHKHKSHCNYNHKSHYKQL